VVPALGTLKPEKASQRKAMPLALFGVLVEEVSEYSRGVIEIKTPRSHKKNLHLVLQSGLERTGQ